MASKSAALLLSLNLLFFTVLTFIPSSSANRPAVPPPVSPPVSPTACCPADALKLGVCVGVLKALALKHPVPQSDCCPLIGNLIRVNAAACLCTSLKLNVLDVLKVIIPNLDLSLLLNYCKAPNPYLCR